MERQIAMLVEARKDKELSQSQVSKILNISEKTLSLYENCHRDIPLKVFYKLCLIYEVSADYILGINKQQK